MNYLSECDLQTRKVVKKIAREMGTPFYLYNASSVMYNLENIKRLFSWQNRYCNFFPVRENPNPNILQLLWNAGCGMLACGRSELILCNSLGFKGNRILYQPLVPDKETEVLAQNLSVLWLATAPSLLPSRKIDAVILRYIPETEISGVLSYKGKTGFLFDELQNAIICLRKKNIENIGLDIQVKSFDYRNDAFVRKAEKLFSDIENLSRLLGVRFSACCLGDAVRRGDKMVDSLTYLEQDVSRIRELWELMNPDDRPDIYTAFSYHIMENTGILVASVLETRLLHRNYCVLDAGICQFTRPALLCTQKDISVIRIKRTDTEPKMYHVVGTVPEDFDRLTPSKTPLHVSTGDLCVLHNVGCGARSMPMLYNFQPLAAEYLIETSGAVSLIAPERTSDDIMKFILSYEKKTVY